MDTPAFIITIDTEGDNLWQNSRYITTENARFLPRFQTLCEKYRFKPVYLTNYEMAIDSTFVDFARNIIANDNAEIGMHLHAWNTPPAYELTGDDRRYKPYLIEYPETVMQEKILFITKLLEETFQTKMLSHRAGRWAFNECYASILLDLGYKVDCSVTPRVDWSRSLGSPLGNGGSNYRHFPDHAYFVDLQDISHPGTSQLLEVPITTAYKHTHLVNVVSQVYNCLRGKHRSPSVQWLRPNGNNATKMYEIAVKSLTNGSNYVEFMLHSSEFMPGANPTFKDAASVEQLYNDLEVLFNKLQNRVIGMTLAQYYQRCLKQLSSPS